MHNPFIFFEMNFDPDIFHKYYGSIDSPGIYAIPEDEVEPKDEVPDEEKEEFGGDRPHHVSRTQQNMDDKERIQDKLAAMPELQAPQLNPDEQAAFNREIEPVKKAFLIEKLQSLSHLLKNKFSIESDLDLILKYAPGLSYRSLYILAINLINKLKLEAQDQEAASNNLSGESISNVQNVTQV